MSFFPSQDSGPYTDAPGGSPHDAEQLQIGVVEIPNGFFGELEARIVGDVLVTGAGQNAGEKGHLKRRLTIDVKREGNGSIEIMGDAPVVSHTRTSDNALGFVFAFQQGDLPGTLKLMVNGVQDRTAAIDVRFFLSGSNIAV